MDKPKPPILEYEVRKVMPMSRRVLLAATGGAAAVGTIVVAGVIYRAATRPVVVVGDMPVGRTTWQSTTQPVNVGAVPGNMPAFRTNWGSTTRPVSGDTAIEPSPPTNLEDH